MATGAKFLTSELLCGGELDLIRSALILKWLGEKT